MVYHACFSVESVLLMPRLRWVIIAGRSLLKLHYRSIWVLEDHWMVFESRLILLCWENPLGLAIVDLLYTPAWLLTLWSEACYPHLLMRHLLHFYVASICSEYFICLVLLLPLRLYLDCVLVWLRSKSLICVIKLSGHHVRVMHFIRLLLSKSHKRVEPIFILLICPSILHNLLSLTWFDQDISRSAKTESGYQSSHRACYNNDSPRHFRWTRSALSFSKKFEPIKERYLNSSERVLYIVFYC